MVERIYFPALNYNSGNVPRDRLVHMAGKFLYLGNKGTGGHLLFDGRKWRETERKADF